jgi:hypothetical protein
LLPNLFEIHQPSHHPTSYSLGTESVIK